MKKEKKEKFLKCLAECFIIIAISGAFLLGLKCGQRTCLYSFLSEPSIVIGCINCIAAVANALLLYANLSYQGRSFRKERFETTLFNIIENHRNFIRGIKFRVDGYDHDGNKNVIEINADNLFVFSHKEISKLTSLIQTNEYPNLSADDLHKELSNICLQKESAGDDTTRKDILEKEKGWKNIYELSWRCQCYKISEDDWTLYKNDLKSTSLEETRKLAFKLFYEQWILYYKPYIRSIKLILIHIYNSDYSHEEKVTYFKYVTSQMTNHEQFFIKCYCCYDEDFRLMIETMTDNSTNNKNN
ncbi:MAG: hypothetical protein IJ762_02180 [Bacteroidaceae bacterium]|nr:hypothetical protein [Bacteroidaceae bacterium]